jgi:cytoskeleton protein RodZ
MTTGARLRRAREEKGVSLDALSRVTRVTLPILAAIEQEDLGAIPPRPFGRGFVRIYASEVGLDPDQVVREYFSRFTPVPPPSPPAPVPPTHAKMLAATVGPWVASPIVVTVATAVLAVVVIAAGWGVPRAGAPRAVSTAGVSAPAPVGTAGRVAPPATAHAPTEKGVSVALEATGPSWVAASVDGRRVIYRTLQPGDRQVLRARQEIWIRTGNAGALRWQIGGGAPALMGKAGEVRTARITAADTRR